jgi:hypothetical protein
MRYPAMCVCNAMPCNTMQNLGLERNRREGEGKKGCELLIYRGLLSCREDVHDCTRGFICGAKGCSETKTNITEPERRYQKKLTPS